MKIAIQFSRIFVGVLFIISGFIKANDTIGFSYKLEEYFEVFHMPVFIPYAVGLAMFICIFEIIVGVALLMGAYQNLNSWLLLIMILFFTWLTGYSAITNKVTDCGCFGDAVKLKPVESFLKDLILLIFILIIFIGRKHIKPLFNKGVQMLFLGAALFVVTAFTLYTYMFLPVIDFLPYKVGNDLYKQMEIPEGAPRDSVQLVFIYEKDGQQVEISLDQIGLIDDSYTYVDRKDKLIRKGYQPPIHDFKVYDATGMELADSILSDPSYKLILTQKDIDQSRPIEPKMAKLFQAWGELGYAKWAFTSSALEKVEAYRHEHQLPITYVSMDPTPIKSMVRSTPGLMLMKGSVVIHKWSSYNFPDIETIKKYLN